ncbi:MAG TPA: 6-phosphogluconolactonase [Pyrinomonadaceae bacterium]|nr:6-phosphogluconolactonase [Pyrinomonadaceae bacterium]
MPNIQVFETPEQVARAAAQFIVNLAKPVTRTRPFTVALSGGNTPRRVYELLATDEFKVQVNWQLVQIFFGDERPVPPDDPASNYGMALATLISRVPIPESNVHPISGAGDPHENASSYQQELKSYFAGSAWPRFDLILLGMGEDGHTASLFPGSKALSENEAWVAANWVELLDELRITLTAPAINSAVQILFLVTGANKTAALAAVLSGPLQPDLLPAQLIKPSQGELVWMVDAAAASRL